MSEANRQAIERMFSRVIVAARKFGMPDEEIQLIVEIELFGEGGAPVKAAVAPVAVAPAHPHEPAPDAPTRTEPGPDKIVPELDEPEPDWGSEEREPGEIPSLPDGEPLTLESLGLGRVERPVRLKPPPKTKEEKEMVETMLGGR